MFIANKDKIFLFNLDGVKLMHTIDIENHVGRIILSPDSLKYSYLIYSDSLWDGQITLFDTFKLEVENEFIADPNPILSMNVNFSGNLLATIST